MASNARRPPLRTRTTLTRDGSSTNATTATASAATTAAGSRIARVKDGEQGGAPPSGIAKPTAGTTTGSSLGTRKRAALGDLTNANRARTTGATRASTDDKSGKDGIAKGGKVASSTAATGSKVPRAESSTMAGKRPATRTTEAVESRPAATSRTSRRTVAANGTTATSKATATTARTNGTSITRSVASRSQAGTGATASRQLQQQAEEETEVDDAARDHKRVKVDEQAEAPAVTEGTAAQVVDDNGDVDTAPVGTLASTSGAKDEGWEDLDAEDADDPLMVAEYVNEIFHYMKDVEMTTMPNGSYMDTQADIDWTMRGVLVDWLIDIHSKFRMLPETLFLALNVVDRFLTIRAISLNKLQLVGLTAMFIAAKYEEVLCPSVGNFLYLADGGYDTEEILKAERYMLKVLGFNLSYANPMNFLRRISKADNYDIQTRTVAKYFMEISLVDFRLLEHPPSLVAAASIWMARKVLERGPWTPTLVHYSSYSEYELLGTAEIMLDYTLRPIQHSSFHKKYAAKKFMRASNYVVEWARTTYPDCVVPESEADAQDFSRLRIDLFAQEGMVRPSCNSSSAGESASRQASPAV